MTPAQVRLSALKALRDDAINTPDNETRDERIERLNKWIGNLINRMKNAPDVAGEAYRKTSDIYGVPDYD